MVSDIYPDASSRFMYGGTVFEKEAGNSKTRVAGYFVYENHLSLEFSWGVTFSDPEGHLEGRGLNRRHLKLRQLDDVENKRVDFFIEQAFQNR